MKKILLICIVIILLAVFCYSGWQLLSIGQDYRVGEKTYESIEQYARIPETTPRKNQTGDATGTAEQQIPEKAEILWPEVDFEALQEVNPDVVAWLYIEGTEINYPVMQGRDNDQYLYRLITGEHNSAGSLFLEAGLEPDFSGPNNPVYGHNMKNGSMFAGLTGYKNQKFYEEHPVALLMTPNENYQVKIFSAYVLDADGDAWDIYFTEETLAAWQDQTIRRSYISTDVIPTVRDRILTMSTCSYETDNSRFLVHGILIPE